MPAARSYHPATSIQRLPRVLANQIAAGEVVERPASIVKELMENAFDAGADQIDISLRQGGLQNIRVTDNGYGIRGAELELAVSRHATSKIASLADLENIASMGFRGEALASISSVARLTLRSRARDQAEAWQLVCDAADDSRQLQPVAHPTGTTVEVAELFYNTPARRRFLRAERTEYRYIEDMVKRLALSRFDIGFSLRHNHKDIFRLPPAASRAAQESRLQQLWGKSFLAEALHLDYAAGDLRLWGWAGLAGAARSQADLQYVYVNGRSIRDRLITHALRQAYQAHVPAGRHAAFVLFLELDPLKLDVNVHPTKHEVRFRETRLVHDFLERIVGEVLGKGPRVGEPASESFVPPAFYKPAEGDVPTGLPLREPPATPLTPALAMPPAAEPEPEPRPQARIIGSLQGRYILAEDHTSLVLVDVHALRSQQLLAGFEARFAASQQLDSRPLLIPQTVSLPETLYRHAAQHEAWLAQMGLDLSLDLSPDLSPDLNRLGEGQVLLRQVPAGSGGQAMGKLDHAALLVDFLQDWHERPVTQPGLLLARLAALLARHELGWPLPAERLFKQALELPAAASGGSVYRRLDQAALDALFGHD